MKQSGGQKFIAFLLFFAMILSMQTSIVFAEEVTQSPIVSEENNNTNTDTCPSCGKIAHEGACETTESFEPEVAIPTTEEEKECTCPTLDSGEVTHMEGCPQYVTPSYQCPFCKDERLDEHEDGVCPLSPVFAKMQMFTAETTVLTETELQDALDDAPTDGTATTIKLGESFSVDQSVTITTDKNIILDLNGFTLSSSSVSTITVTSSGSLEIIDTSTGAAGVVSASGEKPASGENFHTIDSNGTVKISSGTITINDQGWAAINNRGGSVEVTGGTVSASNNLYVITNYDDSGVVNVSGGTVSAPSFAINNQGTVNITGGMVTVSGNGYAIINSYTGIVNVSGGEVTAPSSAGIAIRSHNGGIVNVTGGTLTAGENGIAIDSSTVGEEVNISGGTIGIVNAKKINLSGNPTLSMSLSNMENNQISIIGELTGAEGGIMLNAQYGINPALTVIATATSPEHAVVEKFSLINALGKSLVKNGANIEITQLNPTDWDGTLLAANPNYTYSGGDGLSESTSYQIANSYDLAMLAANVNAGNNYGSGKFFKQTTDIVLNDSLSGSPKVWTPIGTESNCFNGTFDGEGHTVKGVYFNNTTGDNRGLFGYISGATIQNVGIIGGNIRGKNNVGGIVGKATDNSVVEKCFNTSSVYGIKYIGGIAGYVEDSIVQNCYNTGNIIIEDTIVGGVVGYLKNSTLQKCYNTGNILKGNTGTASLIAGGIVGHASSGSVKNCVALGLEIRFIRPSQMSRVVGSTDNTTISYCYARQDMFINGAGTITSGRHDNQNGEGLIINSNMNCDWGRWFGVDTTVWTYPSGELCYGVPLPTLKGFATDSQKPILPGQAALTLGEVKRTSDTEATVKFTVDDNLTYYYAWVPSGDAAPTVDITQGGITAQRGVENTITLNDLSAGEKELYIVGINTFGVRTNHPKTTIPAYTVPTITIAAQPQDVTVLQGKTATFRVTANLSTSGTLSYQWYSNTSNSNSGGTLISGATGATYALATATVGITYFYCVVSGGGATAVKSNAAMLTVNPAMNISGTIKDVSGNPVEGAKVKLTPTANTTEITTDSDGKFKFTGLPAGDYTVTVTFPDGSNKTINTNVSNGESIDVGSITKPVPIITITTQTQNVTVLKDGSASFGVAANISTIGSVSYQWFRNTANSTVGGTPITDATSATYNPATATVGSTYYYCVVSGDDALPVTSKIARLTVLNTSTISGIIQDKDGNPVNNSSVKLTPDAGTPNPVNTGSDGKYTINDIPDGEYTIIVTLPNGGGTIAKDITVPNDIGKGIDMQQPSTPTITVSSQPKNISVALNDTATFTVKAGASSGTVAYQWYKNTTNSVTDGTMIIGANDASYNPSTAAKGESYYYCVLNATGAASVTTDVAKLTVRSTVTGTTITGTVQDSSGNTVASATVTITDKNNPGNKHATITAANGTYTFINVPDGNYTITVKLPDGSIITKEITVSDGEVTGDKDITQPKIPVISISFQPRDVSVTSGQQASFAVAAGVSSGTVTYQWYSNASNSTTGGTLIFGATNPTYSLTTTTAGTAYYYCVISCTDAQSVTSKAAKLTVTAATAPSGTIQGNVTDDVTHSLLSGVEVKVMKGGTDGIQFGGTIKTGVNGEFEFKAIPYGSYSLVATKGDQTVTKQININAASVSENLVMLSGNTTTKVVVKENTPSTAAENLEEMFTTQDMQILKNQPDAKIEIKLVVEKVEKPDESEFAKIAEIMQSHGKAVVGLYLDAKLLKTITSAGGENISDELIQPPEGQKVRIVLDIPTELQGKAGYLVVRVHEGRTLTITPEYNPTLQTLIFDADKFSTYAIVYTTAGDSSNNAGSGSSGGSNSSDNDAYDFWQTVKNKIDTVADGDTIKVNPKSYDKMPISVMNALRNNSVNLIISWNGGTNITIPAGKAQKPEAGRIYYPLSLLEELYKASKMPVVLGINPESGGVGTTQGTSDKFIPVTGGVWEFEAPATVKNEMTSNAPTAITPPTGGFETDTFAGTPDNAAASNNHAFMLAWIVAMLAALAGFLVFWGKKKNKQ